MDSNFKITGIQKEQYPSLYSSIEKLMALYDIGKVRVVIRQKYEGAATITLVKNFLIIGKPLLENLDNNEIEGVLSHEFSHIYNRDTFSALVISIFFMLPFFLIWLTIDLQNITATNALFVLLALFFWIYGFKVRNWIILNYEIRADREAVIKTKNPAALQNALIKLTTRPFFSKKRPGFIYKINESLEWIIGYFFGFEHPHLKERIEYLDFANRLISDT